MGKPKVVQFPNPAQIYQADANIIAEVITVRPEDASAWLKCNHENRPLRKKHVERLAEQMKAGQWQLNGQAIVIADNEEVLDGQHRLFAVIEAGIPIQTLVVYGISKDAFKTIDTGVVRTAADALFLYNTEVPHQTVKAMATAAKLSASLERGAVRMMSDMSNTDVIAYCQEHPTIQGCVEELNQHQKEARPITLGVGAGLYEMFRRKHAEKASEFMNRFFSGEELKSDDPEYLLRQAFIKDAQSLKKMKMDTRIRMVIKGWNWIRRGNRACKRQVLAVSPNDEPRIRIF